MRPMLGGLHGFLKAHGEDGPVGAICLKVRDIGGELFDDRGSGHFLKEVVASHQQKKTCL